MHRISDPAILSPVILSRCFDAGLHAAVAPAHVAFSHWIQLGLLHKHIKKRRRKKTWKTWIC